MTHGRVDQLKQAFTQRSKNRQRRTQGIHDSTPGKEPETRPFANTLHSIQNLDYDSNEKSKNYLRI